MSSEMEKMLNDQVGMEAEASFLYLSMSSWCDYKGMTGCAQFFQRQAEEEHMHMMKLVQYLQEMDARAIIPGINQPSKDFEDPKSLFEQVLQHEKKVTSAINDLVEFASKSKDHSTYNFLQWYVEEQREEENLMRTILDKINLIGDSPQKLYYIDKELEIINNSIESATA